MRAAVKRRQVGTPAMDLLEEAVGLLRQAPPGAHIAYFLGAIPFWLGLLYYLSDMSQGAYAASHIADASFGMAMLYLWKKCWQAVSAGKLRATLSDSPDAPWNFRRVVRMVLIQATIQPWGLLLRPVAGVITVPFVWVATFFQNAVILGDGADPDRSTASEALQMAKLWPRQMHAVTTVIYVFTLFVWINVFILLNFLPQLLKMFFAVETAFSRGANFYVNTTFLAATVALTSLAVDPLRKAVFVIRCFRGKSLSSGADLGAELRRVAARPALAAAAAIMLLLGSAAPSLRAEVPLEVPTEAPASELDRKITEVLERPEFSWRAPREKVEQAKAEKGWLGQWMSDLGDTAGRWTKAIFRAAGRAYKALTNWLNPPKVPSPNLPTGMDWVGLGKALLMIIGAALAGLLIWFGVRLWKEKRSRTVARVVAAPPVLDLREEHLVADQLPEDGWLKLAREHAARGELTLALRAAWLAGLAHLGQRELIGISRHKTNRDYGRELRRRAREREHLLAAFDRNLRTFERSWYGDHEVTMDGYQSFEENLSQIRQS